MPSSSSAPAVRLGVKRPSLARWFFVREVVKPSAPARTASRTRRPIVVDLGGGRRLRVIRAALAHHVEAQRRVRHLRGDVERVRRRAIASRYSGKLSHRPSAMPSASAVPGMSSTPSISLIR